VRAVHSRSVYCHNLAARVWRSHQACLPTVRDNLSLFLSSAFCTVYYVTSSSIEINFIGFKRLLFPHQSLLWAVFCDVLMPLDWLLSHLHTVFVIFVNLNVGSDYVSELQPSTGLLFIPRWHMSIEPWWSGIDGKIEELREKSIPAPLCPPQIPHGLTWDSAVRGRQLTAWAMAQPCRKTRANIHALSGIQTHDLSFQVINAYASDCTASRTILDVSAKDIA
jgi:hypothetical protein